MPEDGLLNGHKLYIVYMMSVNEAPTRKHSESFPVSAPDKFDCADGKEWPKWIRRFQRSNQIKSNHFYCHIITAHVP